MKYLLLLLFGVSLQAELDLTLPEQPAVYIPPEPTKAQLITFWTLNVLDVYTTYEGMKRCSTCVEMNPFLPNRPELEHLILHKAIVATYMSRNGSEDFVNVMNISLSLAIINNYSNL
jgi:hypothetical protein